MNKEIVYPKISRLDQELLANELIYPNGPDLIFVVGPAGAGKTEFINTVLEPMSGHVPTEFYTDFTNVYDQHAISHANGQSDHYHPWCHSDKNLINQHTHELNSNYISQLQSIYQELAFPSHSSDSNAIPPDQYIEERNAALMKNDLPVTYTQKETVDKIYKSFFEQICSLTYDGYPHVIEWAGGVNILNIEHPASEVNFGYQYMSQFFNEYKHFILPRVKAVFHVDTPLEIRNKLNKKRGAIRSLTIPSIFGKDDFSEIAPVFPQGRVFNITNKGENISDFTRNDVKNIVYSIYRIFWAKAFKGNTDSNLEYYLQTAKSLNRKELLVQSDLNAQKAYTIYRQNIDLEIQEEEEDN